MACRFGHGVSLLCPGFPDNLLCGGERWVSPVPVFVGNVLERFLLGHRLITTGRPLANRVVYIGIFLFSAVWIFGQQNSTFRLGTYVQWQAGNAPWFYEDSTFLTMLIASLLIWAIGLAWFLRNIIREGKELEA